MAPQPSSSTSAGSSPKDNFSLFAGVYFAINDSIAPPTATRLAKLLETRGATKVPSSPDDPLVPAKLTHFITDTLDFPEYRDLRPHGENNPIPDGRDGQQLHIVSPFWVTKSFDLQNLQPPRYYSADRALFFSGFVFCASELPTTDTLSMEAAAASLGAQWRNDLTREVTHLFVPAPSGAKYELALKYGLSLGMVILLPHWFEECIKLAQLVPTYPFEYPSPPLLAVHAYTDPIRTVEERLAELAKSPPPPSAVTNETMTFQILGGLTRPSKERDAYHRTAVVSLSHPPAFNGTTGVAPPSSKNVFPPQLELAVCDTQIFENRRVYLAGDLGLRPGMEEALKSRIEGAGGTCWSWRIDGGDRSHGDDQWERRRNAERELAKSNLVVVRHREGWEYWNAYDQGKAIGNLPWMYFVLAAQRLSSPLDRLMHYPTPSATVPAFEGLKITISNYSGPARDYVRTLIETLGAKFEGAMSKSTDYVITASDFGQKVKHAKQWGVPIVTHLWLEACVIDWALVPVHSAPLQFLAAGTGVTTNFTSILGQTPLPIGAVRKWAAQPAVVAARADALKFGEEEEQLERAVLPEVQEDVVMEVSGARKDPGEEKEENTTGGEKPPKPKSKPKPAATVKTAPKGMGKAKQQADPDSSDDDDDEPEVDDPPAVTPKKSGASKKGPAPAPTHLPSSSTKPVVSVPTARKTTAPPSRRQREEDSSSLSDDSSSDNRKAARRRRSSASETSPAPVQPPSSAKRIDFKNEVPVVGKRAAANTAAQRLKEQMPDANKFAHELQRSKKRKRDVWQRQRTDEPDSDSDAAPVEVSTKWKGKGKSPAKSTKKKQKLARDSDDSSESSDDEPDVRPAPSKALPKSRKVALARHSTGGGVFSSFDNPPHAAPPKKHVATHVRVLSTGLGLGADSDEIQELTKLGAKWCDAAKDVTHLVVQSISRTENFLTALASAPKIVTKKWVTDSIAAGKLLDETKYFLRDAAKEREIGDTLINILDRARAGKLFSKITIYLTPKIAPPVDTLRKIIMSGGGNVVTTPFEDNRTMDSIAAKAQTTYIVSCPKDRLKWEKLLAKHRMPIYSVEAVFQSVMHQRLRFYDDFRIDSQPEK